MSDQPQAPAEKKIVVRKNGSYKVSGGIPLVRKVQVVTEHGEPYTWTKTEVFHPEDDPYFLCRCGHSQNKPFCDGSHKRVGFDGTEKADTRPTIARRVQLGDGRQVIVRRDYSLCMEAGFCGNRFANLEQLAGQTDDPNILAQVIGMVEKCPSGSYTYALQEGQPDIEPDLPEQISVTIEMTDSGPIMGALWVTGNIAIERSDGEPLEMRNRVTLCRCGESKIKPLCDGRHRQLLIRE